jgi:hypothetical protein
MSFGEFGFLALVTVGFVVFALALAYADRHTNGRL